MSGDIRADINENVQIMEAVIQHGQKTSLDIWNLYRDRYRTAFTRDDPRSYTLARISGQAQVAAVLQEMTRDVLSHPRWWEGYYEVSHGAIEQTTNDVMSVSWQTFYNGSYAVFEQGIRELVRALDPQACNGASHSFKNVMGWLFSACRRTAGTTPRQTST